MRILIAEDDPVIRRLLEAFLTKWGYQAELAVDGSEAWKILQQEDSPRLAILDWMMPGMDGSEICREVRKLSRDYTYLILLTTRFQKEDIVAGLEAGADDYLTKPFDSNELRARVRTGERIMELQQDLLAAQQSLEFQATHDSLTGLLNRASIQKAMRAELARSSRNGSQVGVFMADLDYFKQVNDTCGHAVGDAVLREVARRMVESMRPYDLIGRYGGEEFLIVALDISVSAARSQAERLLDAISKDPIEVPERGVIPVTLSLGIAMSAAATPDSMAWLLNAADEALYEAKAEGRNRFHLAPESVPPPLTISPELPRVQRQS